MKALACYAQLRSQRKKRGEDGGQNLGRHHEHQSLRNGDQLAFDQDVSLTFRIIRCDELIGETDSTAEVRGVLLFCKEGIRPCFDYESVDALGKEDTPEPRAAFVEYILDRSTGAAILFKTKGRGQAGNSSADDRYTFHVWTQPTATVDAPKFLHSAC